MTEIIKNRKLLFLLVLIGIIGISANVFALELNWPKAPGPEGIGTWLDDDTDIAEMIQYFYRWSVALGGLVAFITLVFGGTQYITSYGNTTKMADARERISNAFLGLILLLSAYFIFDTINPDLTTLEIPELQYTDITFGGISTGLEFFEDCEKISIYLEPLYEGASFPLGEGETYNTATPRSIKIDAGNCGLYAYSTDNCTGEYVHIAIPNRDIKKSLGDEDFNLIECVKCVNLSI